MTVAEAISEARTPANTSNMSEACFRRLDAARTLADEVERLQTVPVRAELEMSTPAMQSIARLRAFAGRVHDLCDQHIEARQAERGVAGGDFPAWTLRAEATRAVEEKK